MSEYWDKYGTPTQPHVSCPQCGIPDEVGSDYDRAWCCACGWKGSLTKMRVEAFDALLEASSLGGPEARAIRAQTPRAVVDAILRRVDELDREKGDNGGDSGAGGS